MAVLAPESPTTGRTFASLRTRNFRLFFIGQIISNTGNWLTMVALTLLVLHRTGSGVSLGLLAACQFGPILVLSPWAGAVVDRTDKRRLLLATQSLAMVQSLALAALAFTHHAPIGAFYATAAFGGCLLAIDNPVRRTFVNAMVSADDVSNAVSLNLALVNVARIIGPALAGLLVVTVGYGWCFTADALTYLVVLAMVAMMRNDELRPVPVTPRGKGQVRAGLRYVLSVRDLWVTFVMLLVVGTISYNFTVVIPLFVEHGLHGSDATYTLVYAAFSAGALVGALLVARRRTVTVTTVTIGTAALGVSMLALSAVPDVGVAFVAAALVGAASVAYMTATTALAQLRTDPRMMGRVVALQTVLVGGTTPIGAPILGAIADSIGARAPVYIGGAAALLAAGFGWFAIRRASQLEFAPTATNPPGAIPCPTPRPPSTRTAPHCS